MVSVHRNGAATTVWRQACRSAQRSANNPAASMRINRSQTVHADAADGSKPGSSSQAPLRRSRMFTRNIMPVDRVSMSCICTAGGRYGPAVGWSWSAPGGPRICSAAMDAWTIARAPLQPHRVQAAKLGIQSRSPPKSIRFQARIKTTRRS